MIVSRSICMMKGDFLLYLKFLLFYVKIFVVWFFGLGVMIVIFLRISILVGNVVILLREGD